MPLRFCSFKDCGHPAERNLGSCMICAAHLCFKHKEAPFHLCPQESSDPDQYYVQYDAAKAKHYATLFDQINLVALTQIAQAVRGVRCTIPSLDNQDAKHELLSSQMGGQNCHIDIEFADGVKWIARFRLSDPFLPPDSVRDHIIKSEVAVLKFLETTQVPAPRVYYHTLASTLDEVGVPYMLMEKLPGRPLDWNETDESHKQKILYQLSEVFIELQRHPLDKQGSPMLIDTPNKSGLNISIGPYAQVEAFTEPEQSLGPYETTQDAANDIISAYLDRYTSGELDDFALETALTHRWRLELNDRLYSPQNLRNARKFYLKHCDDKGDHILIDENFNITGIIDWEFASAECEEVAFGAPCMLWPVRQFYDGDNNLSADEELFATALEEKGATDLAELVRSGRLHQRFWFFARTGATWDHAELVNMFDGLRNATKERFGEPYHDLVPFETWKWQALQRETSIDPRLAKIQNR